MKLLLAQTDTIPTASAWERIVSEVSPPYLAILVILGWLLRTYHLENKERREGEKKLREDMVGLLRDLVKFTELSKYEIGETKLMVKELQTELRKSTNDDETL